MVRKETDPADEGSPLDFGQILKDIQLDAAAAADRLEADVTVDVWFCAFLRRFSRFGYFTYGPITIDVRLVGDLLERTAVRRTGPRTRYGDDWVRFSLLLADEARRGGQRTVDELHLLLAFMRWPEGLPARVFGELGVAREQVQAFSHTPPGASSDERLFSPEDAAAYLGVHVQTVRAWIRSGRLHASRLAGQRALRISASDLRSVLEPVLPEDI